MSRSRFYTILALVLSVYQLKAADNLVVETIIEQQVLSQKITALYVQLYYDSSVPSYYQQKDSSILKFEKNLDLLESASPNQKIGHSIEQLKRDWKLYKKIANWSITKKGVEKIMIECDYLLQSCNQLLKSYEKYHVPELQEEKEATDFIDISFPLRQLYKQQLLAYRILFYYIAVAKDSTNETNFIELKRTHIAYDNKFILYNSSFADINSYLITSENIEMRKYWQAFESYLVFTDLTKNKMKNMFLTFDQLIKKNKKVITLYRGLNQKFSISKLINLITSENMLIQRISKSYVALSLQQKSTSKFKNDLLKDINLFEKNITILFRNTTNEDVRSSLKVLKLLWKNYKKMSTNWQQLNPGKVLEGSHLLMASCDNIVLNLT